MVILTISESELNETWDRIEARHPWGPMQIGEREPSRYLLRAVEEGLVSREIALELYMGAVGIGCTDP